MVRALLLAPLLALTGCQLQEPTPGGTVLRVVEAERVEAPEPPAKVYEDPLVPEFAWQVDVRLDDGSAVTVTHEGPRRFQAGERVRLIVDSDSGELLL